MMSFPAADPYRFDARGLLLASAKYGPRRALTEPLRRLNVVDDWRAGRTEPHEAQFNQEESGG
jgi:hypothetical protein